MLSMAAIAMYVKKNIALNSISMFTSMSRGGLFKLAFIQQHSNLLEYLIN